jgi:hypothetical protein
VDDEHRSRLWNARLFHGDPDEMLCSRIYRHRCWLWPLVALIDIWAVIVWSQRWGHCRHVHAIERERQADAFAAMNADDIARRAGL